MRRLKALAEKESVGGDTEVSAELARALSDLGLEDDTELRRAASDK